MERRVRLSIGFVAVLFCAVMLLTITGSAAFGQTSVRFGVIGDYYGPGGSTAAVATMIKGWNPDFIVTAGDNSNVGTTAGWDNQVGQFFHEYIKYPAGSTSAYAAQGSAVNKFFPAIGNHDADGGMSAMGNYLELPGNERYYEFVQGPVHFFVINSNAGEPDGISSSSTQAQWLQTHLAAAVEPWKIVVFHHPAYSSSSSHGPTVEMQWPFAAWGATAVISGHDHTYEHLLKDGVHYFINGVGGTSLYGFNAVPDPGSITRYSATYGAMQVDANLSQMTFRLYSISGGGTLIDEVQLTAPAVDPEYTETFDAYPTGVAVSSGAQFDGGGPNVEPGIGVNGSQGLSTASTIFNWTEHPFNWSDASFQKVILGMDFQASDAGTFDDDRVAWIIDPASTSSDAEFGVQLDNSTGSPRIEGYWDNVSGSSSNIRIPIVSLTGLITNNAWYRLRAEIVKLTATSAQINAWLSQLNAAGDSIALVASGSIANTAALAAAEVPDPKYFNAATIYASYKNFTGITGAADNAYLSTFTGVTPGQFTLTTNVVGNGTVGRNPNQFSFDPDAVVTLTANPSTGYQFSGWSGDLSGSTNPTTITMTGNKTVTATFEQLPVGDTAVVVPFGATWKYSNTNAVPGAGWQATAFDDAAWPSGPARIGGGDPSFEATSINIGPAGNVYPTIYFRTSFNVANPGLYTSLGINLIRDDGAVIYLNGTEVWRSNMPAGTITHNTLAAATVGGADETAIFNSPSFSTAALVTGTNVLAVEVHQINATSTDLGLDLRLYGITATAGPKTLTVNTVGQGSVTKVPDQAEYDAGTVVQLTATPNPGWNFAGWSGDLTGTTNPVNVTMNTHKSITATFVDPLATFVGHWKFDETNGTTAGDATGNNNTATVTGGTWGTGKVGGALTLNATTGVVNIPPSSSLSFTNQLTFACWFNASTLSDGMAIFTRSTGTTLGTRLDFSLHARRVVYMETPYQPAFYIDLDGDGNVDANESVSGGMILQANTWYHLAVTYDGASLKFYIDGTLRNTVNGATGNIPNSGRPIWLGADEAWGEHWPGKLDDVRLYKKALTQAEIQALVDASTLPQFTLTANVTGNGIIQRNPALATYDSGSVVQVSAIPQYGYAFSAWSGDLTGSTNPQNITMTGNKTITATFVESPTTGMVAFAAVSDYGSNSVNEQSVASLVTMLNPDFVVTAGDNDQIDGTQYDLRVGQYYHNYIGAYTGSYGSGAATNRFFPSLGNHDVQVSTTAYQNFFTLPGAGIASSNTSGNERYYDFVQGPVHFFIINANSSEPDGNTSTSTQALWLQGQLAVAPEPWKVVIFHEPPFTSGSSHTSELVMRWPFEAWGATAVFNGHNHVYERVMRDDNSDGVYMPYFTIGLGGHAIDGFGTVVEGSQVRYNGNYGTMFALATDTTLTFRFYAINGPGGTIIDTLQLVKWTPGQITEFLETFNSFAAGQPVSSNAGWFTDGTGPTVGASNGVAGSQGLNGAQYGATWTEHTFNWNDPNLQKVVLGMDFQTSPAGVFDDDRVCWTILNNSTSSDAHFGVQLDNTASGHGIETYWDNISGGSSNIRIQIAALPTLSGGAWYRLRAEITKLTATSVKIDVMLYALDAGGNQGALVASGSLANTEALSSAEVPDPKYFTATTMWPGYKNFSTTEGMADNAYFGLMAPGTGTQFALTVNVVGSGSVTKNPDQTLYDDGAVVQLTANALPGFEFTGWSGALTGTTNPANITMTGNKVVTATFAAVVADSTTFVPFGATWKYLDNNVDQGTAWRAPAFNDASWASGPARLGFGDVQQTVVNGGPADARYPTIYFRTSFNVTDPSLYSSLGIDLIRDDGAVIYLNGTEIWRSNMPAGTVTHTTWASSAVGGADETATFVSPSINTSALIAGTNVLAVEIHQSAANSTDLGFNMRLYAVNAPISNETKTITQANTDVSFPASGVVVNLSVLPAGGGNISITRHEQVPAAPPTFPNPPAGATYVPLWLEITSTMAPNSFVAHVTLDVNGIAGFGPASRLMCYNTGATSWIPVPGTYDAGNHTFTFTAYHFSDYGFANPAGSAYELYVDTTPADTMANAIYPNTTWGPPTSYEPDWSWTGSQVVTVYLAPQPGSVFGVCNLTAEWDSTVMRLNSVNWGSAGSPNGLYGSGQSYPVTALYDQLGLAGRVTLNCSRLDNTNFTTADGDYVAALNFTLLKPGYSPVSIITADVRAFVPGNPPASIFVTPHISHVRAYLGDVASSTGETAGDGKINFDDLVYWSYSYWSGVPGYEPGMTNYKTKYDIGPTQDGSMSALPVVDSKIDFEDLVMFSLAYGESNAFHLPKLAVASEAAMTIAMGEPSIANGETRVPVLLSGDVQDVRALSMTVSGRFGRLISVEKGALLQRYSTPVILMSNSSSGRVNIDLGIAGLSAKALSTEGELVILRFAGSASVGVSRADARSSANASLAIKGKAAEKEIPVVFALDQNYPNPFNPTTMIQFQLPSQTNVEVRVYNLLGEEVATLVNEVREAGVHTVEWNGMNNAGAQVTSGIYFYRMRAGDFTATRKMLLLK